MKLQSENLKDYLKITPIIDWDKPEIIKQTNTVIQDLEHDIDKARALFEWVRDTIPHSRDIGSDVVTCSASEVLNRGTGICFAKSHLLAAMLLFIPQYFF
jgi:transglutaminase-like putative cysteine protease